MVGLLFVGCFGVQGWRLEVEPRVCGATWEGWSAVFLGLDHVVYGVGALGEPFFAGRSLGMSIDCKLRRRRRSSSSSSSSTSSSGSRSRIRRRSGSGSESRSGARSRKE